jgi:RNA polymerase sigma factor (sigma-70 family)
MLLPDKKTRKFTEVYSDLYPLVYSVVHMKVSNTDDVEDICQEIFFRFHEKFDEIENPRKWLLGTLKYVVYEHYRKKYRKDICMEDVFEDMNLAFVNGFRDTRIIIEEALNDMDNFGDEKERILFELISIYNYSHKQAGEALGYTRRQVRYRYETTAGRLISYLREKGIHNLEDLL